MSEAGSIAMAPTGARDSFVEIERPPIDTDLAGFFIFIDFHYFEFWPDHWDDARLRQWIEWYTTQLDAISELWRRFRQLPQEVQDNYQFLVVHGPWLELDPFAVVYRPLLPPEVSWPAGFPRVRLDVTTAGLPWGFVEARVEHWESALGTPEDTFIPVTGLAESTWARIIYYPGLEEWASRLPEIRPPESPLPDFVWLGQGRDWVTALRMTLRDVVEAHTP
jgi:hypothetical protein